MFCRNCGNSLNGSENVCPNCGTPVQNDMPQMDNGMNNNMPQMDNATPEIINSVPQNDDMNNSMNNGMNNDMNNGMNNNMPTPMNNDMNNMPQMNNDMNNNMNNMNMGNDMNNMNNMGNMNMNNGMNGGMNNNMPQMNNGMNNNMPTPMNNNMNNGQPKNNKTMTIVLVAVLVVVLVGGGIFFFMNKKDSQSGRDGGVDAPVVEPGDDSNGGSDNEIAANTVSYNGYTFTLPDGCDSEVEQGKLFIYHNAYLFSIEVDFSNGFTAYEEAYKGKAATENFKNRKYIIVKNVQSGFEVSSFATSASSNATFTGYVLRSDKTYATAQEYNVLSDLLDSASSSNNCAAGDKVDAGKDGIVDMNKPSIKTDKFNK